MTSLDLSCIVFSGNGLSKDKQRKPWKCSKNLLFPQIFRYALIMWNGIWVKHIPISYSLFILVHTAIIIKLSILVIIASPSSWSWPLPSYPHLHSLSILSVVYLCANMFHCFIIHRQLLFQYKFAPDLIMLDAYETVESWMITKDLNPRKLIPAMMRYSSEPHAK